MGYVGQRCIYVVSYLALERVSCEDLADPDAVFRGTIAESVDILRVGSAPLAVRESARVRYYASLRAHRPGGACAWFGSGAPLNVRER